MPTKLEELHKAKAHAWSTMEDVMARTNNAPTGDDAKTYDEAHNALESLSAQIERAERHEGLAAALAQVERPGGLVPGQRGGDDETDPDKAYAKTFASFLRNGMEGLTADDRRAMAGQFQQPQNAQGVGTGSAGGYVVPPEFRDRMVEVMKYFGPMLQVAEIIETNTGANLPWPTADDTGNVGAILAENTAMTEQDVTVGTASLDAYMYTSKLVRVSYQLLQDRPDFDTWLAKKLGERIGRIWNAHFTTGTGSSQPDGIVTSATVGVAGTGSFATTGGITYAQLVDLTESMDEAYLGTDGAIFMGHQSVRKALRKIVDGDGRPMWSEGLSAGVPSTIFNVPFRVNNDMATLAASSKSLIYGNMREAYAIRIVRDILSKRLEERYAEFLQVGFFAFARADGTLQNANAVRVFQTTSTA